MSGCRTSRVSAGCPKEIILRRRPVGQCGQQVSEAVRLSRPYGTGALMEAVIEDARRKAAQAERSQVASEIRTLVESSGLSSQDFARRIGTSASRLCTYMSAKVTPSAALMIRMRRVGGKALTIAKGERGSSSA
jgi:DNA-binding transcriptional regulator YiaG